MGNSMKNERYIRIFNNTLTYKEVESEIIRTKVNYDSDFLFFIDCTKSNMFVNGSSRHNIPNTTGTPRHSISNAYRTQTLSNPYYTILDIIGEYPFYESEFMLYFFGTKKSESNSDKLEHITITLDDNYKTIHVNKYDRYQDLLNGYIMGITDILQNINGDNCFDTGEPIIEIIDKSIEHVKNTNKFTISIIIIDGIDLDKKTSVQLIDKIVEATNYPLEIVCIGIGDSDFDFLEGLDNYDYKKIGISRSKLRKYEKNRKFDNFRTFILKHIVKRTLINKYIRQEIFRNIFVEVPQVYSYIQKKNIIGYSPKNKQNNHNAKHNYNESDEDSDVLILELDDTQL